MAVSFNQIPIDIRTPGQYVEFDNSRAVQGLPGPVHRVLLIGQRLASGAVEALKPTKILGAQAGIVAFGAGSILAAMVEAFKRANPYTECWAVALDDDAAGVAATGSVTVTGTATKAGVLTLYVGGQRVRVAAANDDTAAVIATRIVTAINGDSMLPAVAAAGADGAVELTAKNKGHCGNSIDLRVNYYPGEMLPKGLSVAISPMAGGTADPDITTAITAIGDTQYHTIVTPYTQAASLTTLEGELAQRWGPMVQLEGHAFAAVAGAYGMASTLGSTRNSPHLTIMACGKSPTLPWVWASVVGAVDAFEPDPARPRQTLPLVGIMPPEEPDRFTRAERNLLLQDGVSTHYVDDGGRVLIERLITTYQTNPFGFPDISYLDITTMRTLAYLRFTVRSRVAARFPRHKLAGDGTNFGPGQAIVTPSSIRAEILALFRQWEGAGLVEGFEQFKTELVVKRNKTDPNRVDAVIPPDLINQLRVFAGQVQFLL